MPIGSPTVVLLASAQEWASRSLESILRPAGYTIVRAYTGPDAIAQARRAQPDAVILDADLPTLDGLAVCRALRSDAWVTASTPILVTMAEPVTRQRTLEALRAGANALWGQPLDTEEFLLRLEAMLRAKFDADRARTDSLVDQLTGLYNRRGLTRRARELASQASRLHVPLACVVFEPELEADAPGGAAADPDGVLVALAHVLAVSARVSDAIGRVGPREFAVLAPDTDASGAAQLGTRVTDAVQRAGGGAGRSFRLRAGYDAITGSPDSGVDPEALLAHATTALHAAAPGGARGANHRIQAFEEAGEG
ncbi:MAG TPA: diguanylate cyclase [Gemmatimonadales bacterium]|nr:diguanylate cyclase [Gemmatimonadales bacterium]